MADPLRDPIILASNLSQDARDLEGQIGAGYLTRIKAAALLLLSLAPKPGAKADSEPDPEDDAIDGVLFRFWIRASSYPGGWPSAVMATIEKEIRADGHASPAAYRRALLALAREKGVNLPG